MDNNRLDLSSFTTEAFLSTFKASDLGTQVEVWSAIREEILRGNINVFYTHMLPLLTPIINHWKNKLPEYGTYREDFVSEVSIDLFLNVENYAPHKNGESYLGSVYFGHRIHGVYTKIIREYGKDKRLIFTQDETELESIASLPSCSGCLCDEVVQAITSADILEKYRELRSSYGKYYARKKTRGWAEKNELL